MSSYTYWLNQIPPIIIVESVLALLFGFIARMWWIARRHRHEHQEWVKGVRQ